MSQLFSRTACKRSISPAKGAKRLLDPGRKRAEGIKARIDRLLARVGVVRVVSDLFVLVVHPAKTTALLRAAFIID